MSFSHWEQEYRAFERGEMLRKEASAARLVHHPSLRDGVARVLRLFATRLAHLADQLSPQGQVRRFQNR